MFQFYNSTINTDQFELSTDGFLNLTKCDNLNLSQVINDSCANVSNGNQAKPEYNDDFRLLYGIFEQFVYFASPVGLIMNILNIIAIANAPSKMSPHSKLVISLAVSDMCVVLPALITRLARRLLYRYGIYECYDLATYSYFEPSVTLASLFNLLSLGIDQFIAIVKPLHYNRIVSNSRTRKCIVLIWLMSFFTSVIETLPETIKYYKNDGTIPEIIINYSYDGKKPFCFHMIDEYMPRIPYFLVIPELIVLIILYTRIYVACKMYVTRRHAFRSDDQHNNKAIVTTLLVIGTFMMCWIPYSMLHLLAIFSNDMYTYVRRDYAIFIALMCKAFILLNSSCDALIYAFRLDVVKQGYRTILRKLCRNCQISLWKRQSINGTGMTSEQTHNTST